MLTLSKIREKSPYTAYMNLDYNEKALLIIQSKTSLHYVLADLNSVAHTAMKVLSGITICGKLPKSLQKFVELPLLDTRIVEVHTCTVI